MIDFIMKLIADNPGASIFTVIAAVLGGAFLRNRMLGNKVRRLEQERAMSRAEHESSDRQREAKAAAGATEKAVAVEHEMQERAEEGLKTDADEAARRRSQRFPKKWPTKVVMILLPLGFSSGAYSGVTPGAAEPAGTIIVERSPSCQADADISPLLGKLDEMATRFGGQDACVRLADRDIDSLSVGEDDAYGACQASLFLQSYRRSRAALCSSLDDLKAALSAADEAREGALRRVEIFRQDAAMWRQMAQEAQKNSGRRRWMTCIVGGSLGVDLLHAFGQARSESRFPGFLGPSISCGPEIF